MSAANPSLAQSSTADQPRIVHEGETPPPAKAEQATEAERSKRGLPLTGDIRRPVVTFQPEPEFSEQARRRKKGGNVSVALTVALTVGVDAKPSNVRVIKGVGYRLDQASLTGVKGYRFKPATQDGVPIP